MKRLIVIVFLVLGLAYLAFSAPAGEQNTADAGKKILSFWGIYDVPNIYQPVIDQFEASHPGIKVVYKQFADREEYQKLLDQDLAGGKGPDILLFDQDTRAAIQPYLIPAGADDTKEFPAFVQESFVSNRLLYALPLWVDSLVIYYNKRYYPEGIKPQWYDFAAQTQGISIGGVAMGRLDNLRYGWDILKALFAQKGIVFAGKAGNSLYDTLEFFSRFASPNDRYFNWNETLNKNYPDEEVDSFIRGKVAAIAGYGSLYHFFAVKTADLGQKGVNHIKGEDIGVSLFPQFTPDHPRFLGKYLALGVSIHSQIPNQAWELIRLLTDRDQAVYYLEATGRTPGRFIPITETDSPLAKIQKLELPDTVVYPLSPEIQNQLSIIVGKGLKNKNALKEALDISW